MMIDELLLQAHQADLSARGLELEQRMALAQFARVERLERALRRARARLRVGASAPRVAGAE